MRGGQYWRKECTRYAEKRRKHNTHYKKIRRNEKSNETRGIFKWRWKRMGGSEKNRQNQGRKKKRGIIQRRRASQQIITKQIEKSKGCEKKRRRNNI